MVGAGCAAGGTARRLQPALSDYHAGRYAAGLEGARRVLERPGASGRYEAAYLAGLCAYRLRDHDAAERYLQEACGGGPAVRGRARAALGLMRLEQGRAEEGAADLEAAAADLDGPDARHAMHQAAEARGRLAGEVGTAGPPRFAGSRDGAAYSGAGAAGFTLQVGAFRDRRHAEAAAADAAGIGRALGLAPVDIVPRSDERGVTLYFVHLGRFGTRGEADDARQRMGRPHFIVAPIAPTGL